VVGGAVVRGLELGTRTVPLGLEGGAGIETSGCDSDELIDDVDGGVDVPWDIADAFCFFLNLS
jgi:hypothetical protein